jgi:hypothetical protein
MLSKLAYSIVGLAIVALSFSATLFALNRWSSGPSSQPLFTSSISAASGNLPDTSLEELPKLAAFNWFIVRGLNVRPADERAVVAGQPILRLVATASDTGHSLVAQYHGLGRNQVYRITAWVRPEAGGNVEVSALDQPNGTPVNTGTVIFDLSARTVLNATGAKAQGMEAGPDNWQKVWLDMATSDGQFLVAIRPARGNSDSYRGDGKIGVTLGGIQMLPRNG